MSEEPKLSGVLADIEEACGSAAALQMAAAFGGREIYIPRPEAIGESHPIAQAVGLACGRKIAAHLAHGVVLIPLGPHSSLGRRRDSYRRLRLEGRSLAFIARALGVHIRTIKRYGAGEAPSDQLGLFDAH